VLRIRGDSGLSLFRRQLEARQRRSRRPPASTEAIASLRGSTIVTQEELFAFSPSGSLVLPFVVQCWYRFETETRQEIVSLL
jgi:hypothetical protein